MIQTSVNLLDTAMMRCAEFNAKTWDERRSLAWPYYVSADLLARAIGPLAQANDDTPAALGCSFANWAQLKRGWCECHTESDTRPAECFWHNPDTSAHGWMCPVCKGMTQVG